MTQPIQEDIVTKLLDFIAEPQGVSDTLQETSKRSSVITNKHAFIIDEDKISFLVNQ
jgi:hypothetical protein